MMKIAFISLGNPLKCDDNIANIVLSRLKREKKKNWFLVVGESSPENFIFKIKKYKPDRIYIIDAIFFGGKVGDVKLFRPEEIKEASPSTHSMPLCLLKKFIKKKIKIIGIQPKKIEYGRRISKELMIKLDEIVLKVKRLANN